MSEPAAAFGTACPVAAAASAGTADLYTNAAWRDAAQGLSLSVVVPFFEYNVEPLARRLLALAERAGATVPLIFVDDGSKNPAFHRMLWAVLSQADQPCQLAVLHRNAGRAKVRNYLCQLARTPYLLYFDADMWPDDDDCLVRYLGWIAAGAVDVIYGGRSAQTVVLKGPQYELHRLMTVQREALPARVRREYPAFHFYSCNFMVRKEILQTYPLDVRFTGWGWEDIEWASRVEGQYTIRHEDNPASHLGLLTAAQMLAKYDESVGNFTLMLQRRPDLVTHMALFQVARMAGKLRLQSILGAVARRMAQAESLPIGLRMRCLMLYKAALYAPVAAAARL